MFWECNHIQAFWVEINSYLNDKFNFDNQLTYETISFCNVMKNKEEHGTVINFIVLLAKYFIFKNKCNKTVPSLIEFKQHLLQRISLEKTIATIKDKLDTFSQKWQPILSTIQID